MEYLVSTQLVERQTIASIRERHKETEFPEFLRLAFAELFGRLSPLGVEPSGMPFVIYHEFGPEGVDAEVCVPVSSAIPAAGRIKSRVMPAMTVARTLHVGPYDELHAAYAAVSAWIERNGLNPAGPTQERYLNGPGETALPAEYRTEVEMPIATRPVAVPA